MSQIQMSLLLHRKALHWLLGAACLKNKLSQKYPQVAHISFAICGHQENHFRFILHKLCGSNNSINIFRHFRFDSHLLRRGATISYGQWRDWLGQACEPSPLAR